MKKVAQNLTVIILTSVPITFIGAQKKVMVNVSSDKTTLYALISYLQSEHQLAFGYSSNEVDVNQLVQLKIGIYEISDLLSELSTQLNLDVRQNGKRILLRRKLTEDQLYFSLKGELIDENGEGIPFANVYLENTQIGTFTDEYGAFALTEIPRETQYSLVFSAIGYTSKQKLIDEKLNNQSLEVTLLSSFVELEPVEVTTGSYQLLTYSVGRASLTKQQIEQSPNLIKDVFRTISMIPSISNTDFSVKPRIRGGSHHETGIYLDGFELINPFHIEIGGGVQGLFNTDYVEAIKVYPGSFSAK